MSFWPAPEDERLYETERWQGDMLRRHLKKQVWHCASYPDQIVDFWETRLRDARKDRDAALGRLRVALAQKNPPKLIGVYEAHLRDARAERERLCAALVKKGKVVV